MYPAKPSDVGPSAAAPVTGVPVVGVRIPTTTTPSPIAVRTVSWSFGLCDCMGDCGVCCMTCWCPCITFGRVAEILDRGGTSCCASGAIYGLLCCFTGCHWIYSCMYRSKMRAQFGIHVEPCCDCCVHFCCEPCVLCQHYRELKKRNFEPELGWDLNVQRGAGADMYPPAAQGMAR
nr:unnamed protein product [Digitaria exilis]